MGTEESKTMNTIQKIILGVIAVAIIVIGFATFSSKSLGDATVSNYPTWYYNGIVIGSSNSLLTNLITGTCNLAGASSTAATTSATCTVAGALVGDKTQVSQTSQGTSTFYIVGSSISSANTLSVILQNASTTAATPNGGTITGVNYEIFR